MFIGIALVLFVGTVFLLCGILDITYEKRFMKHDVSITKGTIIEICHKRRQRRKNIFYPRVEYIVDTTIIRRALIVNRIDKQKYHVGDVVDIAYRKDMNTAHIILGNDGLKGEGMAGVIFGCLFILIGMVILFIGIVLG